MGAFSQDLRHGRYSRRPIRICKIKRLIQNILKDESSSCQCSMTSSGQRRENQKDDFRISNNSRTTQKGSRVDIGVSSAQEMKKNGTERTPTNMNSIAEEMVVHFKDTGHPVFRGNSALKRGVLRRKGGRCAVHFNADYSNTVLLFRTISQQIRAVSTEPW